MTTSLTFQERLNLRGVIGQWRGWEVTEIQKVWTILDRLSLNEDEAAKIGYRIIIVDGAERDQWDVGAVLPEKEYTFNNRELNRIKKAIRGFKYAGHDRIWLSPILKKFEIDQEDDDVT